MEDKKETSAEVEEVLEELENADLVYNPFSAVPNELLIKALMIIEEHHKEK